MNILINGVGPRNKGAELMLLAILEQIKQRLPEAHAVVRPTCGPYHWRAPLGLYQLLDSEQSGRLGWLRKRLLHQGYRERFGLVLPEHVDVVLDASGYAVGDVWGPVAVEGVAHQLERYKKLGAAIILLPQAFGPFENTRVRSAAARVLATANMVFARDAESLAYCQSISPHQRALFQAPDFTNLVDGKLPGTWVRDERHVALVPNRKMLVHSDSEVARTYVPAMAEIINKIAGAGYAPFVLIHETMDTLVASQIVNTSRLQIPIVNETDPLISKAILSTCAFTIGSRFHGLVSALSQGVPSIGTGWSHKYRHLLEDYGMGDALWTPRESAKHGPLVLDDLLDVRKRQRLASNLQERSAGLKSNTAQLWDNTVEFILTSRSCQNG